MRWLKYLVIVFFFVMVLPGLIYLGLAIYYRDSFIYGTWINGIYCTGKTVYEAADELEKQFDYENIIIQTPVGTEVLTLKDINLTIDFIASLNEYRHMQNPYLWFARILSGNQVKNFQPSISFDKTKLEEWIVTTQIYQRNLNLDEDRLILELGKDGYRLREEKQLILNTESALDKLEKAICSGEKNVELLQEECFFYREETLDMQMIREKYDKIEKFQKLCFRYQMKDSERKITPYELAGFIKKNENQVLLVDEKGDLVIDEKQVEKFIDQLSKECDTWNNHIFHTHDGEVIHIKKGNYGTKLSKEKEKSFLKKWLNDPKDVIHIPSYQTDVTYKDRNKIDYTYVEIDLGIQKMFYYVEGVKVLETDVVTGCVNQGMATPEMVCYIRAKTRNATLRGPGYSSFVNYWMPVYGGIGIHDAGWRDEFGGEIYMKSGSHGCINTPLEKVADLFENIEVGTPVVVHR